VLLTDDLDLLGRERVVAHLVGGLLSSDEAVDGPAGPEPVKQRLQRGGGGSVDQARHQRQSSVQGWSHACARRSATGQGTFGRSARRPAAGHVSPRPGLTTGTGWSLPGVPTGTAWSSGARLQTHQQKLEAQQTSAQWRRIARSARACQSAHPYSCFTCLYPCPPTSAGHTAGRPR
jgi:hypothetical protein